MVNPPAITLIQQNFGELLFLLRLLFGFNYAGVTLGITCIAGTIYSLEEIAMTLILPVGKHDVLNIFHALNIHQELITPISEYHDSN